MMISMFVTGWAVLLVLSGERQDRSQQIQLALADAAEQVRAQQKKRQVQAAVAAVAKSERMGK